MIKYVDWWFAYTNSVKSNLAFSNYPNEKITVVENAIDTKSLAKFYSEVTADEINLFRVKKGFLV